MKLSRALILLSLFVLGMGSCAFAADVFISLSGTEQQISGAWDTGGIKIAFSDSTGNSYSETVPYGQYSSSASIASALAGMFSRDYLSRGLCAHSVGSVIYFHLKGTVTFGPLSITDSSSSFSFSTAGWQVTTASGKWIINTVAGDGSHSYSGDQGAAINAGMGPTGVAVDSVGNLYIADQGSFRIREVSPSGYINTVAGGGSLLNFGDATEPATSVALYQPSGVAVDSSGNVYIADPGEALVFKVTSSTGNINAVAGGGPAISVIGAPIGDNGSATSATLTSPSAVAVDPSGNLYIADTGDNRIRKVTPTGIISTVAGSGPNGDYGSYAGDGETATNADLYFPQAVALDSAGNIYIADTGNNRIRKVTVTTPGNIISTVAGGGSGCPQQTDSLGDGCLATNSELNSPLGIAIDGAGNIYIADTGNNRIRMVAANTGDISTIAGTGTSGFTGDNGPATAAEIYNPIGLAIGSGNIYFADSGNGRVRMLSPGIATPIITWTTPSAITFGTALSSAQLNAVSSVPGTFVYSSAAGTVLAAGAHTLSVTFTPSDTIDYSSVTAAVTLNVNQATPTITWSAPANIQYGTALSATQLDASSNTSGSFTYSPTLGTVLTAGPHTLSVTLMPSDTVDYTTATATAYITVTQPSGTWDSGTIALSVNGSTVATTNYGQGATPSSVAEGLAANVSANSSVNVTAVDDAVYIQAKGTGSASNYSYTLQTTSYNSTTFSQPSFMTPAINGTLEGGANQNTAGGTVYGFMVPGGGYDGTGNLLNYTDSVMGTWDFNYDTLNRLTGASSNPSSNQPQYYCWTYDSFGNRKLQASSSTAFTAGSPACTGGTNLATTWANYNTQANNNRIANTSQAPGGVTYDAAGNLVNDGVNQYLYDGDGHICALATPGVSGGTIMTGYIYDSNGDRVAKGSIAAWSCDPSTNGFTTTNDYVLGTSGEQVTEMGMDSNNTMAWQHTNVYGAGKLIATYDHDGLHFYLNDPLGTRRTQTDYAGVLEQTCSSLPFGDSLACSGSTQYPTEHHFTGKERDSESGLDYFGARYYGSSMGRFLSPDPYSPIIIKQGMVAGGLPAAAAESFFNGFLEDPQNLNQYSHVRNNPLKLIDPTGSAPVDGHHLIPDRGSVGPAGTLARDFANKVKTGPLSGNGYPNQPGFNTAHREYNDAVKEMLAKAEEAEGPSENWDVNKWKDFATKILNSDEPAIKDFLDELEQNNPGAKAALGASIAAYRVSAGLIARAVAAIVVADTEAFFGDLFICATCNLHESVTHKIIYPAP